MTSDTLRTLPVTDATGGKRLDLFIGEALALSRTQLRALFDEDRVRVDGRRGKKGQTVTTGQTVEVRTAAQVSSAVTPEPQAPLTVLHEDAQLVALDKPAGRPSHPLKPGELGTVANALVARFPECATAAEDEREGGLCHRLDVETSGVLLAARDRQTWDAVRAAFSQRRVDKRYWALVTGPIADEGEIELPLRHHPRHADRVEPDALGEPGSREALSAFRVLARSGELSLIEVKILTGVLHQVRAHLSAIGAPIYGDALYGGRPAPSLGRFFLHARSLSLSHPATHRPLQVESPLPEALVTALRAVGLTPP